MANICSKCGNKCNEFDLYCSKCGNKLDEIQADSDDLQYQDDDLRDLKEAFQSRKIEYKNAKEKKVFDNYVLNFAVLFFIFVVALSLISVTLLNKHNNRRMELQYKNLISNPAQIPQLKEPTSVDELAANIAEVERFLFLYLKYSTDLTDKKEQIFAQYLNELDKLPSIASENLFQGNMRECAAAVSPQKIKNCTTKLNAKFKSTSINAYSNYDRIYLHPNNKFIKKTYSPYLSKHFREYLELRAKYNTPTSLSLNLYIKPKKLADKIYDFEKFLNRAQNPYIKEEAERTLYSDFRKFIFTPSIYATTTQEMKNEFKNAYVYFVKNKRRSALRPVVMSYLDKKRAYNEDNFKKDYPYKIFKNDFDENVENSVFSDIFAKLRKNIFTKNSELMLVYVYNIQNAKWKRYTQNTPIAQNEYVVSVPDENNNVAIYDSTFSPLGEVNILKHGKLYLIADELYVFNKDKLSVSKLVFNGKIFNLRNLSQSDITSLFTGIEVINIDSYRSYNIYIEKDNAKANYIILSRYMTGWEPYVLTPVKGNFSELALPNMFGINSDTDVVISFHGSDVDASETSDSLPTYKITIHTKGQPVYNEVQENSYPQYDEKTANEENQEFQEHVPNIKPKIYDKNEDTEEDDKQTPVILLPPKQNLEPPGEND